MSHVRVVTDSAADLLPEDAARWGIKVVPLNVNFGEEMYLDRELDAEEFWRKAQTVHPGTSQPSVGVFEETFGSLVAEGADVICVTVTSKHSGTFNSASVAAQRFMGRVKVFDSESLSWGQSLQAQAAAQAAREGKNVAEILPIMEDVRSRIRVFIALNTIEYLKKGGRAARFISVVEKVVRFFNIKPLLTMRDGELKLLGTANSFTRAMLRIQHEVAALGPLEMIGVLHIRNDEVARKLYSDLIAECDMPDEGRVVETGAALSVHGGPGTVAAIALLARTA